MRPAACLFLWHAVQMTQWRPASLLHATAEAAVTDATRHCAAAVVASSRI